MWARKGRRAGARSFVAALAQAAWLGGAGNPLFPRYLSRVSVVWVIMKPESRWEHSKS